MNRLANQKKKKSVKLTKQEKEARKKQQQKKKVKRYVKTTVCCLAVVAGLAAIGGGVYGGVKLVKNSGVLLRRNLGAESAHYEIDNALMTYYYKNLENSLFASGDDYLANIGLDPKVSLRDQNCASGETWFDYLMNMTKDNVKQMLVLMEAANDAGIELTDEDLADVDKQYEAVKDKEFGTGVREEDVRQALKYSALASKYSKKILADTKTGQSEWDAYYQEHAAEYVNWEQESFKIAFSDGTATDSAAEPAMSKEEAQQRANALSAQKSKETFENWVRKYLTEQGTAEADIDTQISGLSTQGSQSACGEEMTQWAMSEDAAVYDTYIVENSNNFTVYLLLSEPKRDETATIDVRHILCKTETYGSEEAAKAKAEEVLEEWKGGDQTEERFGTLAQTYSDDGGSSKEGGLYESVYEGEMTTEFNDWCYDSARKPGDVDIIKTSYGYHVMYFVKNGMPKWAADISKKTDGDAYQVAYDALVEKYEVTIHDEKLNKISPES